MKQALAIAAVLSTAAVVGTLMVMESDVIKESPLGWICGATGGGSPKWAFESDSSAGGDGKVLRQSGVAPFPWCVKPEAALADGWVEVRFRPLSGRDDQAGGVVWRWKDGDNYYVARGNALENNVSLYYTEHGNRRTLKYVDAPVKLGVWHTLRVDFSGERIAVSLDGKRYIEFDDAHIKGEGKAGVWTKADSVTSFADFRYGPSPP
jgi:hypothetical protein